MTSVNWSRLLKHIPTLALLLAAAWLATRIALTAWGMMQFEAPEATAARPAVTGRNANMDAPGRALFGNAPRPDNSGAEPGALSDGNFQLRGVVASDDQRMAHAIIESGGVSGAYFPGDAVAAGMTLGKVRPNEVLLKRSGEVLRLPLIGLSPGAGSWIPQNPNARQDPNHIASDILAAPPRMTLSQFLRTEPVMDAEGRIKGYRIFPRAPRSVTFTSQGLASGDLVVAINGIPINKENIAQARKQMNGGGDKMLSIMRDGEQIEITIGSEIFGLLAM